MSVASAPVVLPALFEEPENLLPNCSREARIGAFAMPETKSKYVYGAHEDTCAITAFYGTFNMRATTVRVERPTGGKRTPSNSAEPRRGLPFGGDVGTVRTVVARSIVGRAESIK